MFLFSVAPQRMGYDQVTPQRAPHRDDSQLKAEEMPDLTLFCLGEENIYLDDFDVKLRKKLLCTLF